MKRPFLSIVTITYKDPVGLKKTLDSLAPLLDMEVSWEHVIVDASLTENSEAIDHLPKNWPLKHLPNVPKGIYSAINQGIEGAKGETILLLHGGDTLFSSTNLVNLVYEMVADSTVDAICAGARLLKNGAFQYFHFPASTFLRSIIGTNRICHQSMLYRRYSLLHVGLFSLDYPIAADYEHHFRCYLKKLNIRCSNKVIADYDMGGTSSNTRQAMAEFRMVQLGYSNKFSLALNVANAVVWWWEEKRIRLFKQLAQMQTISKVLRPLWLKWKSYSRKSYK